MRLQSDLPIESGDWDSVRGEATVIRFGVFVMEQHVPEELELDLFDPLSRHWLVRDSHGAAIATARLTPDNHIGRMAVLPEFRGKGVGSALLTTLQDYAIKTGRSALVLSAQLQAIPFYQRFGFVAEGPTFDDAGIQHQSMRWCPTNQADNLTDNASQTAAVLGQRLRMTSLLEAQHAVDTLFETANYQIDLLSNMLDPALYNRNTPLEALRRLITTAGKRARIRILVADSVTLVQRGHRMIELCRQFSSLMEIRQISDEDLVCYPTLLITDARHHAHWPDSGSYQGITCLHHRGESRRLVHNFDALWDRSEADTGLRRLHV